MSDTDIRKERAYEIFKSKCEKMVRSKFLLAQPSIEGVLKCITGSPELYQFFKDNISNIDCESELYRATTVKENAFILPESKRVMTALVTYLLNQFDNDNIDLMEFIACYYNPDTNIGYQNFSESVITPYAEAVGELFLGKPLSEPEPALVDDIKLNMNLGELADEILLDMITALHGDNSLSESERREMTQMSEGMVVALANMDRKVIIAVWLGMKSIFSRYRKYFKYIKELEKLFNGYSVI